MNFGTPLREAREKAGLALETLAARASLDPDRLGGLEAGTAEPTVGELFALARVLRLDFTALLAGQVRQRSVAALAFRSRDPAWAALSQDDVSALERALQRAEALLEVNERLARPPARAGFDPRSPGGDLEREVCALAADVRARLGNPEGRLPDLVELLEQLDVVVLEHGFHSQDVDAVTLKQAGSGAAVAVVVAGRNPSWRASLRYRVLLAHELCHALFDPTTADADAVVDLAAFEDEGAAGPDRASRYQSQDVPREKRARAFAAELLMPTAALHTMFGAARGVHDYGEARRMVERVREAFGTPIEIALNQLWNRRYLAPVPGLVTEDPRRDLLEFLRRGEAPRRRAPDAVGPAVLERRVQEAWQGELCSDGEARRWLGLTVYDRLPWLAEP